MLYYFILLMYAFTLSRCGLSTCIKVMGPDFQKILEKILSLA